MRIQVCGTGCDKCRQLAAAAEQAARELELEFELVKVTELDEIIALGVMLTPALAVDVGLYLSEGGAVVDVDFFASAITQLQAAAGYTDVTYESAVVDLPNRGKRLWEQLALTVDPEVEYDVALTVTTAAGTFQAGDILMKVRYVLPE